MPPIINIAPRNPPSEYPGSANKQRHAVADKEDLPPCPIKLRSPLAPFFPFRHKSEMNDFVSDERT